MVLPNATLATDCYVPILKCKQGELGAVGWLEAAARPVTALVGFPQGCSAGSTDRGYT
jgi:hypothetical protein